MSAHIVPEWPAPANVFALSTTRAGGHSAAPFDSLNLGSHVGDAAQAVASNRRLLCELLPSGARPAWLDQVHGTGVIEAQSTGAPPAADAAVSRDAHAACVVLTADCLPVLLCSRSGHVVAAAHAGWRGLAAGVVEATVTAMATPPEQLLAWLGPAIGPRAFEVGAEVRNAFLGAAGPAVAAVEACFAPVTDRPDHFLCDLYELARIRLRAIGVEAIYGGGWCTFADSGRFFSYRRDGRTGRMASVIALT